MARLIVVLCICWNALGYAEAYRPPPASVETTPAVERELAPVMWVPGTIVSRHDSLIAAETKGRIVEIKEVGIEVKKGEIIAQIDDSTWRIRLRENEANIKRLEASLRYNLNQLDRLKELAKTNSASKTDLDEITTRKEMVGQELVQARLAAETTQYFFDLTKIRAPFSGQIVARHHQLGEYIQVGQAIVRLVDTHYKEVRLKAPMNVAHFVSAGTIVTVKDDDVELQFPVRTLIPVGDEVSRALELRVPVSAAAWLVGAAVKVALPTEAVRTVIAVERDALVLREDGVSVYRVTADSKAERIQVVTGIGNATLIEVKGDIRAGDNVIVRGAERVKHNAEVRVINEGT